jgi:citrate lyase subunit beta/citryl-CoA lyase
MSASARFWFLPERVNGDELNMKFVRNRIRKIRRSTLIVPANVERYVNKAFERGADTVMLDLEDSVLPEYKAEARSSVRELLQTMSPIPQHGGTEINLRINNDTANWILDLECGVYPRLQSVTIPKCEDVRRLQEIDNKLLDLERERSIPEGATEISLLIESALGLQRLESLLQSSERISSVTLGNEDFCLDLGIEASEFGEELYSFYAQVIFHARLAGVMPLGMVSSISDFTNLVRFRLLAEKSKRLGYMGSSCIHPQQVAILNEVYTPTPAEVTQATRVIQAFRQAQSEGKGACSLDGRMVDAPIYGRALHLLERYDNMLEKRVNE